MLKRADSGIVLERGELIAHVEARERTSGEERELGEKRASIDPSGCLIPLNSLRKERSRRG